MKIPHVLLLVTSPFVATWALAQSISPAMQAKLDAKRNEIIEWAANPVIVNEVKNQNSLGLPPALAAMTQDQWKVLSVLDPVVRGLVKNQAGQFLKSKCDDLVSLSFLSDAKGCKVAYSAKTSNWCHKGMAKHDDPMVGKCWQGPIELNAASGKQQVQIAVPVLEGRNPIGSLVVGLALQKIGD